MASEERKGFSERFQANHFLAAHVNSTTAAQL
jgi:hypothetical protein